MLLVSLSFSLSIHMCLRARAGETALKEEVLIVVVGQLMPPLTPPPPPTEEPVRRDAAKERYEFLMDLGVSKNKEEAADASAKQKVRALLQEESPAGKVALREHKRV